MINNWLALGEALSMPYNDGLMDDLKEAASNGKEFVTLAFYLKSDLCALNVTGVYCSNESEMGSSAHLSFKTKELLIFIERMEGKMSTKLQISLLRNPLAMGIATKLTHNSKSKESLIFCVNYRSTIWRPWITDVPRSFTYPQYKIEFCSIAEFRAWRRSLFYKKIELLKNPQ